MRYLLTLMIAVACCGELPQTFGAQDDLDLLEQRAFQKAVARVDPSLVQIETIGGLNRVAGTIEGSASTTGMVVSEDGEILTSAFVFAAKPTSILVRLADGRRLAATKVATDHVLQLTLLKVDASGLKPPVPVPPMDIEVGQWSLAVGRTLNPDAPSVSVGIVSAVNRVWGKAIQTDAKVSPVNYGGALLDIAGRVQGILVPLSPRSEDSMAGVEWYDSGIGFAIPIQTALDSVKRLRGGKDLRRGLLGVSFSTSVMYGQKPEIGALRYGSPAEKAGMTKADVIVEVDGKPVQRIAQVRHALGNKYAGDQIAVKFERGEELLSADFKLVAELPPWEPGFLGVLPVRTTDEAAGVEVRFVVPDSPAAAAGVVAGDVIVKLNGESFADPSTLANAVGRIRPGEAVEVAVQREDGEKTLEAELSSHPEDTVVDLPEPKLPAPDKKPEVKIGRYSETFETHQHDYWAYVPDSYNPGLSYGLVVWLHPARDTMEAKILQSWKSVCDSRGLILVSPKASKLEGWNANELPFVKDTVDLMQSRYSIDPQRIVVHGYATSAALTLALTFEHRELVRGSIVVGGGLRARPPENRPEYPLQLYFYAGEKDPRQPRVKTTVTGLRAMKYPVTFANSIASGTEYPSVDQVKTFGRWIDSLDRF
ncbi:MAG: PDZ domain-containing protein [Planctomycetaceae bacterium]